MIRQKKKHYSNYRHTLPRIHATASVKHELFEAIWVFRCLLKKINLLDIHKFWASCLYQKVAQQKLNFYPTNFRKQTCVLSICNFLLNQMSCEIISEGKLGEEDRSFPNLYNISWQYLENFLKRDFFKSNFEWNLKFLHKYFSIR